jgi:Flp pilus assembly protein CpaB
MILIAAIVIGALAAYAVVTYVGGIEDRANDNARRVPVVRIAGDIPRGMRGQEAIDANLIEESEIASEFLPETAISPEALDTILAKAAVADLATGQVLVENMFVDPIDSQITAARRIADNNVAITISVDDIRGVAGLIVPGDFVNIMVAQDTGQCGSGGETEAEANAPAGTTGVLCRTARMLFQEVQVLFIDTSPIPLPGEAAAAAAETTDDGAAAATTTVNTGLITFQVPPAAAQLIASVPQDGFYLTLLPQTYVPQAVPAIDPNVALLPGEDAAQMTPYGPNGLPSDETP